MEDLKNQQQEWGSREGGVKRDTDASSATSSKKISPLDRPSTIRRREYSPGSKIRKNPRREDLHQEDQGL